MLHGSLSVEIEKAERLQFGSSSSSATGSGADEPRRGGLLGAVTNGLARVKSGVRRAGYSPYETLCRVGLRDGNGKQLVELYKSRPVRGHEAKYEESQRAELASGQATHLRFAILSLGVVDTPLYSFSVHLSELVVHGTIEQLAAPLEPAEGHHHAGPPATLSFKVTYVPLDYASPLAMQLEVPSTYFPPREGCAVRLYQDAHQEPGSVPPVTLADGTPYCVSSCWRDTYDALEAAEELIYIAGWSVWPALKLVREPGAKTLGELLIAKAAAGVQVCIMVWDDVSSLDIPVLKQMAQAGWLGETASAGVMGTHDETVKNYFLHSGVHVKKTPRVGGKLSAIYKAVYTHHQKSVVCDYAAPHGGMRALCAFMGGIDLTNGRYDTAEHPLFRTNLDGGVHSEDFYTCIPGNQQADGPRQPWEDIHTRLTGPIAMDVMSNFEERWDKASKSGKFKLYNRGAGLGPRFIEHVAAYSVVTQPDDPERWVCQLFRSIDTRSVKFMRTAANDPGMFRRKRGRFIEDSIHRAYIHHIRRAQRFIYIENQYFLGSSHAWDRDCMKEASHMIPLEIALKVAQKIDAGQPFAVYCVIPLYPEGDPASEPVQAILYWQKNTMDMMYKIVAAAIQRNGLGTLPTDYLNFYSLGQRELVPENPFVQYADLTPPQPPAPTGRSSGQGRFTVPAGYEALKRSRRFMIYVHSKLMVVDDEVAIVGSANINMRSMAGSRDTELAVSCYQPGHTAAAEGVPRGQIHGFRMSLWAEHLGAACAAYERPHTLGCVRLVNAQARAAWEAYCAEQVTAMPHHLMSYPVEVARDGTVGHVYDHVTFPDFPGAQVEGRKSSKLPTILTT